MGIHGVEHIMSRMDEYYVVGQVSWEWDILRMARDLELKDTDPGAV